MGDGALGAPPNRDSPVGMTMPDHPSWPAELVEKGGRALAKEFDAEDVFEPDSDLTDEVFGPSYYRNLAQAVLSALSGDLVPRAQADALREDVEEVTLIALDAQRDTFRSQADALAEALEGCIGNLDVGMSDSTIAHAARSALASYRKTTSGASGETEGEG